MILSKKILELKDDIISLYNSGESANFISRKFKINPKTCLKVLSNEGIVKKVGKQKIYRLDDCYFSNVDTEEKAYWLGFILADGCIMKNMLAVSLAVKDKNHLEKFVRALSSNYPVKVYSNVTRIDVTSDRMTDDLLKLGITERKSLSVDVPTLEAPLMKHFWRGVIDGDGCITKRKSGNNKGQLRLTLVGSKNVVSKFLIFVKTFVNTKSKISCKGNFWRVEFAGKIAYEIVSFIKPNNESYLKRKWDDS